MLKVSNPSIFTYPVVGGFMNLDKILSEIDLEISRLQQAKRLLSENATVPSKRGPGRPPVTTAGAKAAKAISPRRGTMSAAGRARIAAAQKARWAKVKKAAKSAAKSAPAKQVAAKGTKKKSAKAAETKTEAKAQPSSVTA